MTRLTPEILAQFSIEQSVISYRLGADTGGQFLLKFIAANGRVDLFVVPPVVCGHIAAALRKAIVRRRYADVRRRPGDPQPEALEIKLFAHMQPEFGPSDRDVDARIEPRGVRGCSVHSFSNSVLLEFEMDRDTYKILRVPPAICFYLPEMIEAAERAGVPTIGALQPSSVSSH
jgi:hypothetical protein